MQKEIIVVNKSTEYKILETLQELEEKGLIIRINQPSNINICYQLTELGYRIYKKIRLQKNDKSLFKE